MKDGAMFRYLEINSISTETSPSFSINKNFNYLNKCFTFYGFRHVHITEATLYKLNNEYHVEPYLTDPFQTYLILPSEVRLCYEII